MRVKGFHTSSYNARHGARSERMARWVGRKREWKSSSLPPSYHPLRLNLALFTSRRAARCTKTTGDESGFVQHNDPGQHLIQERSIQTLKR